MKEQSRIYNSFKNIFLGIGNQILTLILTFISRIIFVKILGAEYLGINGLFSNILAILSVAELGLGSAIIYSMYKPLANNNKEKISALMSYYKTIYNIIAVVVAIFGISLIPFLKYLINTTQNIENLNIYYLLFLTNTVVSYLLASRSVILIADQKLYITKIYTLGISIIQCVLQIVFLIFTHNYILYLSIQILGTFISNLCGALIVKKMYPYINKKDKLDIESRKKIFSDMKSMFFYKIGGVILNNTDNILISVLVGTIWVGYYSNYALVIGAIETFITIIFSALTASVGNLIVSSNKDRQYEVFNVINLMYNVFFGICSIELIILFNDFITIAFGNDYKLEMPIVISIVSYFYIKGILNPIWMYRETTGLFKKTKYIILIAAIINIILSVILGKIYGILGILIATIIARLLTNIWYEPYILYKLHFNRDVKEYFKNNLKNALLTIMVAMVCFFITNQILYISVRTFFIKGIICFIISSLIYYIVYKKTEEFNYIKNNIFDRIISRIHTKYKEF